MADPKDTKPADAKTDPKAGGQAQSTPASDKPAEQAERRDLAVTSEREEDRIDPRLDNRRGAQRPPLEEFPAKPQQIDGPEMGDPQPRPGERAEDDVTRKGMKSPGPHGLGDTEAEQA